MDKAVLRRMLLPCHVSGHRERTECWGTECRRVTLTLGLIDNPVGARKPPLLRRGMLKTCNQAKSHVSGTQKHQGPPKRALVLEALRLDSAD